MLARIEGAPAGIKGVSLFVVPKILVNADGSLGARNGVSCGSIEHKMGIHGNSTCVMNYDGATGWLIGEENKGMQGMFVMMNEARLGVAVPVSLLLVLILLYFNFGSVREALLSASVLPLAVVGGVLILALTHTPLSVSATIGFIALFGISIMNGLIIVSSFNENIAQGMLLLPAIRKACDHQLRPVVMTCIAACVGLLPAALSNGIGSQVQKPLALVVVGGSLVAPFLILLVLPVLLSVFGKGGAVKSPPLPARSVT